MLISERIYLYKDERINGLKLHEFLGFDLKSILRFIAHINEMPMNLSP